MMGRREFPSPQIPDPNIQMKALSLDENISHNITKLHKSNPCWNVPWCGCCLRSGWLRGSLMFRVVLKSDCLCFCAYFMLFYETKCGFIVQTQMSTSTNVLSFIHTQKHIFTNPKNILHKHKHTPVTNKPSNLKTKNISPTFSHPYYPLLQHTSRNLRA